MADTYILALDQGTSSSRAILFDRSGGVVAQVSQPFPQHRHGKREAVPGAARIQRRFLAQERKPGLGRRFL